MKLFISDENEKIIKAFVLQYKKSLYKNKFIIYNKRSKTYIQALGDEPIHC